MSVKFKSLDKVGRKVTFDVDGQDITRPIADNVTNLDKHIEALARGLAIESKKKPTLKATKYKSGDVLIDDTNPTE